MEPKSAISSVSLHAGKHLKVSPNQISQLVPFLLTGNSLDVLSHFTESLLPWAIATGPEHFLGQW